MFKPKRIFIVADIKYKPIRVFVDQMPKLSKGFIRLGNDVRLFSYCHALSQVSPLKGKTFARLFSKSRVGELLVEQIKNYKPDIVYVSFTRLLCARSFESIPGFTASGK